MNEVDHWHDALGELKNAFKDESTMSNVSVSNLVMVEEEDMDMEGLENIDDQVSFHSTNVMDSDKYKVEQQVPDGYKDLAGQPGLLDVSSYCEDEQQPYRIDASAELNNISNLIKLDLSEMKKIENGTFRININDDDSIESESLSSHSGSGSVSGSNSSHSDGSLLFNAWNEDYEGNPDPEVLKRLLQARSLPRGLDPYIKTQIKRAKIIQKLQELEDDISSKGSCEMMFDVVCGPRFCGGDSDAGTADTNSLVLSIKEDDSLASLDTTDFMFRKPQKSPVKYSLTPDKKYKPAQVEKSFIFGSTTLNREIPIQKLTPPPFVEDDKSEGTYEEKEMEFTLQNFEGLLGNIPTEINVPSDDEASIKSQDSENSGVDEEDNMDLVVLRMKRDLEDDDSILDDRSIMTPSEASQFAHYMRTQLNQLPTECPVQKYIDLEYFLKLFSNPDYKSPSVNLENEDIHQLPQIEKSPEAVPSVVINGEEFMNDAKMSSIASTFDVSLNPIESTEYNTVPSVVKPTNLPQRFISELSCSSDIQEMSTCSDRALFKAAPLIESATTLLSADSYDTDYREDGDTKDAYTITLEELSVCSKKNTIQSATSKDSVDLLMDALDLNLQNTTTFPSSEGEELVFGLPVDGVFVQSPQSKFGRIISPEEFDALQTISESMSHDSAVSKNDADDANKTHDEYVVNKSGTVPVVPLSSLQDISNEREKKSLSIDTIISHDEARPSVLSPSSTLLHNKLGEIENEFKQISEELDQMEYEEQDSISSMSNLVSDKPTVKVNMASPRGKKPTPLSPRNIQSDDSFSTVSKEKKDLKDDLNDLKRSISKRRGEPFDFSAVES